MCDGGDELLGSAKQKYILSDEKDENYKDLLEDMEGVGVMLLDEIEEVSRGE